MRSTITRPKKSPSSSFLSFLGHAAFGLALAVFPAGVASADGDGPDAPAPQAAAATGQEGSANDDVYQQAIAEGLFREGRKLLQEGKAGEACVKLETSLKHVVKAETRYWLAECHAKIGRVASAQDGFRDVATALSRDPTAVERAEYARKRAEQLTSLIPVIKLHVPPDVARTPSLRITLDDKSIPSDWWDGAKNPVDFGEHFIVASAPKKILWRRKVRVEDNQMVVVVEVPMLIDETPSKPSEPPGGPKLFGVLFGGFVISVGAASILSGFAFAYPALDEFPPSTASQANDEAGKAFGGGLAMGLGVGLIGLGTSLMLSSSKPSEAESKGASVNWIPVLGPGYGGVGIGGRF